MKLTELLSTLSDLADKHNLHTPYIVGGVPRSVMLGDIGKLNDIDITTGYSDIDILAGLFGRAINQPVKEKGKGHKSIKVGDISFDFSTNFIYDNIEKILEKENVSAPTDLLKEAYSRDFTVNSLLMSLDLKKIYDPTKMGKSDIENEVLRCPLDCNISFVHDPKRILRAFHMKARHGFNFSEELEEAIKNNANMLETVKKEYARQIINSIVRENEEVLNDMIELGVSKYLPLTKELKEKLLQERRILDVL